MTHLHIYAIQPGYILFAKSNMSRFRQKQSLEEILLKVCDIELNRNHSAELNKL